MARRKELLKERDLASARLVLELQKLDHADAETLHINKELQSRGEVYKKGKAVATPGLIGTPRATSPVKGRRSNPDASEDSYSDAEDAMDSAEDGSAKAAMAAISAPTAMQVDLESISESFQALFTADHDILKDVFANLQVPPNLLPSAAFLDALDDEQHRMALRMGIICWKVSKEKVFPWEYQITATIAIIQGKDSIIDIGTGYGKTLCLILPMLQLEEFILWGLRAISINQDTLKDKALYSSIVSGKYNLIIVQPEQLGRFKGHMTRFAELLRQPKFTKQISRMHADEAHFISLQGSVRHGNPAFRPAYGNLDKFRLHLPKNVPFQALLGTLPPHIKSAIVSKLLMDGKSLVDIQLTSNRANMVYATHAIVGSLTNYQNLSFLIPKDLKNLADIPHGIIFVDDKKHSMGAIHYLQRLIPAHLLRDQPEPLCRLFFATESASAGIHVTKLAIAVQYGLTADIPTDLQRGSRASRDFDLPAIFLMMYEPWALTVDISSIPEVLDNPDMPNTPTLIVKQNQKVASTATKQPRTSKKNRAAVSVLRLVLLSQGHKKRCIHEFFTKYLDDKSPEVLKYMTQWCSSLQGPDKVVFYGHPDDPECMELVPKAEKDTKNSASKRPVTQTVTLCATLRKWRDSLSPSPPMSIVWPSQFILDDTDIQTLAAVSADSLDEPSDVTDTLDKSEEWDEDWVAEVLEVVHKYDLSLKKPKKMVPAKRKRVGAKKKGKWDGESEPEEDYNDEALALTVKNVQSHVRGAPKR
ncbi:hypothetical protein C8J56DRAFT_1060994 [Mycena floridula]|nr:hypothetical protein C8J56DRAFT_1060994 [Mycena floridula]